MVEKGEGTMTEVTREIPAHYDHISIPKPLAPDPFVHSTQSY